MRNLPPVTKNLLWITFLCWLADVGLHRYGVDLSNLLGLHYISAQDFHIWQPITYMFMHANFGHIFCNMFAVLMFGPAIEERWGGRRFLIFYLVSGLGAAIVQETVWAWMYQSQFTAITAAYGAQAAASVANRMVTIGASGAVFGILFAFAWLFPEVEMFLLFIPIPIRARVFVIIYALIELFAGLAPSASDNVAHFAHLGGLLFGWLLILWWRHKGLSGCDTHSMGDTPLSKWLKTKIGELLDKIKNLFPPNKNRIHHRKDTRKSKDYGDYHYHEPL